MSSTDSGAFEPYQVERGIIRDRLDLGLGAVHAHVIQHGPNKVYYDAARSMPLLHSVVRSFVLSHYPLDPDAQPPTVMHNIAVYAERGLIVGAAVYRAAVGADQFSYRSAIEEGYLRSNVRARELHPNISLRLDEHMEAGRPTRDDIARGPFKEVVELNESVFAGLPPQELELYGNSVGYMVRAALTALQEDALRVRGERPS